MARNTAAFVSSLKTCVIHVISQLPFEESIVRIEAQRLLHLLLAKYEAACTYMYSISLLGVTVRVMSVFAYGNTNRIVQRWRSEVPRHVSRSTCDVTPTVHIVG